MPRPNFVTLVTHQFVSELSDLKSNTLNHTSLSMLFSEEDRLLIEGIHLAIVPYNDIIWERTTSSDHSVKTAYQIARNILSFPSANLVNGEKGWLSVW